MSKQWATASKAERRKAMKELLGADRLSAEDEELVEMEGDVIQSSRPLSPSATPMTVTQIEETLERELVSRRVGELLATARAQSGKSLADLGEVMGVSRGRVSQLEHAENLQVDTLVRFAAALGYSVRIRLEREGDALETVVGQHH